MELERHRGRVINEDHWMAVEDYCRAVAEYFSATTAVSSPSWYTHFLETLELHIELGHDDVWATDSAYSRPKELDLIYLVDHVLDQGLPMAFGRLSHAYAVLRARLL
jgi:hypothetical protein